MPKKMFLKEYKKYPLDYFLLFLFLIIGLLSFLSASYLPLKQDQVIFATAISYFIWSLFHHYRKKDLSFSIVIEYLVLIGLALVTLFFNLLRA